MGDRFEFGSAGEMSRTNPVESSIRINIHVYMYGYLYINIHVQCMDTCI